MESCKHELRSTVCLLIYFESLAPQPCKSFENEGLTTEIGVYSELALDMKKTNTREIERGWSGDAFARELVENGRLGAAAVITTITRSPCTSKTVFQWLTTQRYVWKFLAQATNC